MAQELIKIKFPVVSAKITKLQKIIHYFLALSEVLESIKADIVMIYILMSQILMKSGLEKGAPT